MTAWMKLGLVLALLAPNLSAQVKPKKSIAQILGKQADQAVTNMAAGLVDSALGTGGGPNGVTCPAGLLAVPAAEGVTGVAPLATPTAGTALVKAAKDRLTKKKADTDKPDPSGFVCVPASQQAGTGAAAAAAAAQVQAMAQAQAMSQATAVAASAAAQVAAPGVGSLAKGLAAATPIGMLASGAAPLAFKKLGGLFGSKAPSKEGMIKDLAKGRLVLKHVKFLASSDALEDGYEADFEALAGALGAMEGQFVLNLPPEAADKSPPDTVMAKRRLEKLSARLQVAGIAPDRLAVGNYPPGLDPKKKFPKPGDVDVEILRMPKDFKP